MDLGLKNKVFIVTGGAKGIGEAITRELIKEQAIPVIVGRSEGAAEALVTEIKESGGECLNIVKDLGKDDICLELIEQTMEVFGKIDGIINNAGVNDGVGLEHGSPQAFMESVQTNLSHYYDLVHYALEPLKASKGAVVNISSKTAITGQGGTSGYAASKGAQLALTREWAVELAPYGIRVNAIIPAEVKTPQYDKWLSSFPDPVQKLAGIVDKIPLDQRMTSAEEIAAMTIFLLSNRSAHTTGQWIYVDGGYVHLDRAIT